ncbi:MAG: OprO/OprP family phosphate-selective porin [Lentisphaeraceae bacterium]|nr:OprO/OprP family phosphate-selective porin [Lentisphaeraceae bacterium]
MRLLIALLLIFTISSFAQENEEAWDEPMASLLDELTWGDFTLHGSVSFLYKYKDFGEKDTRTGDFDYERSWIELSYEHDKWKAKAQYAFYRFEDYATWVTFLKKAWVQYTFDDNNSVKGGITRVPFGITPYASLSWWESPAYYIGLEDDYDLGLVYTYQKDAYKFDFGYFPRDEGTWHSNGRSDHSSRYSADVVPEGDSGNKERHQFNARMTYTFDHGDGLTSDLILSLQYGLIPNEDTNEDGDHHALGIAWHGKLKPWEFKLSYIHYEYDLENPDSQDDDVTQFGYFDTFPYNIASKGDLYIASCGYTIDLKGKNLKSVTPYLEYTYYDKANSGWTDSQQFSAGVIWNLGNLYIYSEVYLLREHPDLGSYPDGFASGSGNADWNTYVSINFIYSF